jgi:hypothetical protein
MNAVPGRLSINHSTALAATLGVVRNSQDLLVDRLAETEQNGNVEAAFWNTTTCNNME